MLPVPFVPTASPSSGTPEPERQCASRRPGAAAEERPRCGEAIREAIVDGLPGTGLRSYRRCALTPVGIGWNDVTSAPWAFYWATRGVLAALIAEESWEDVPPQ